MSKHNTTETYMYTERCNILVQDFMHKDQYFDLFLWEFWNNEIGWRKKSTVVRLVENELWRKGRIHASSDSIKKIRWNRHSRNHVLVNKSLMFKFLPLICCEWKSTSCCSTHHWSQISLNIWEEKRRVVYWIKGALLGREYIV